MIKDEPSSSSVTSSPLQFLPLPQQQQQHNQPPNPGSPRHHHHQNPREPKSEERGLYLIQQLIAVASHVANGSLDSANFGLEQISKLTSPDGDPMQRIVAYFAEALADRVLKNWTGLHKALNSTRTVSVTEKLGLNRHFFDLCPFLKLSYVITNQAIFEAMEGEKMVHVIDLNPVHPAQMIDLLQTLSARPEGPPHLRITAVHEHREVLDQIGVRLAEEAEKLDVPFRFNPVVAARLETLDLESLRVKTGEALAVSSVLRLHTLLSGESSPKTGVDSPDSILSPNGSSGGFLSALWGLSPKVVVVTEQESNSNGVGFMERISEALFFYGALFDCLESTVARGSAERRRVEKGVFGEEINNIVACEGLERKERYERLEKWSARLESAGFGRVQLSYQGMMMATRLLRQSHVYGGYKIREDNGCLFICWQDRPLFSVSAWRFRR